MYQKKHWKNIKKHTWKHPKSSKITQTGPRRGVQEQICLLDPQKCKNEAKMAPPRGPLGPPKGPQNRQNQEKKVIQKSSFFRPPSEKGFGRFLSSKMELKWVQNEVSESRGRGNSKKRKNLKFAIPSTKNTYFSRSENIQNRQKPQKMHAKNEARTKVTLQKRFFMILPPFWSSQGSLKWPKNSQKRSLKRRSKKGP